MKQEEDAQDVGQPVRSKESRQPIVTPAHRPAQRGGAGEFGKLVAHLRRTRKFTQQDVAERLDVSRATVAHWETGRVLPVGRNAERLDAVLDAGHVILDAWSGALVPTAAHVTEGAGLLETFRRVGDALLTRLRDGDRPGWSQFLQETEEQASPLSTAYGIKTLLLLGEEPQLARAKVGLLELCDSVLAARQGLGWGARVQAEARPEITAVVLDALARAGAVGLKEGPRSEALGDFIENLLTMVTNDPVAQERTHVIAATLVTVGRLGPDRDKIRDLTRSLLRLRIEDEGLHVWPERLSGVQSPEPSMAHTARALFALSVIRPEDRDETVIVAMDEALQWLLMRPDPDEVTETIVRPYETSSGSARSPGLENLAVRHFTAAWVARALLVAGRPATDPPVVRAMQRVWERYDDDTGLWKWPTGDLPIWMTFQSIAAIRLAALAGAPGSDGRK